MERHSPGFAVAVNLNIEAFREGIHYRRPHTVEAPRGGVGARSEFSTRVELCKNNLNT
jgi:hypothetical protein